MAKGNSKTDGSPESNIRGQAPEPAYSGINWKKAFPMLMLLFVAAFWLRTSGISHDLDLGNVYHPDTPKQMWAAEEFREGRYFHTTGNRDFDGYPFFNSLVVSKIDLALSRAINTWNRHSGNYTHRFEDTPNRFFWIARYLNATYSALAVCILFLLARAFYGNAIALLAAGFLLISPVDISACHYASGDTASAFFALLSLVFALRVYRSGRWYDYMLSAAFCICSFSSKYHGALSVLPLLLAHIMRNPSPKKLFGAGSLATGLLVLTTAVAAFFFTTAGAFQHPVKTVEQIIGFMHYTANFHLAPDVVAMSLPQRFIYSMKINLPVFADIMGPLLFAFAFVGMLSPIFTRRKTDWLIALLPLVYITWGLTSKPASYPVYHTIVLPQLMLLGSLMIGRLAAIKRHQPLPKIAAILAVCGSTLYLMNFSARELFFFKQRDTRVLAQQWMKENVPPDYRAVGSRYSCLQDDAAIRPGPFSGIAWLRCDFREKPEKEDPLMAAFALEDQTMVFRNFPAEVYFAHNPQIHNNFMMPIFNWIPAQAQTRIRLAKTPFFFRNPRLFRVNGRAECLIFSKEPLDSVLVIAEALPRATRVKVKFANRRKVWHLADNGSDYAILKAPRASLPLLRGAYVYKVEMRSGTDRPALIGIGITPLEKAILFYRISRYKEAAKLLESLPETDSNPTLQAMLAGSRRHTAIASPEKTDPAKKLSNAEITETYGIAPNLLNRVPYITLTPNQLKYSKGIKSLKEPSQQNGEALYCQTITNGVAQTISSKFMPLPEGHYTLTVNSIFFNNPEKATCLMLDMFGNTISQSKAESVTDNAAIFHLRKPAAPPAVRLELRLPPESRAAIRNLEIHPDTTATINAILRQNH